MEWKQKNGELLRYPNNTLKPSLVEWKRDLAKLDDEKLQHLETFLGGMETLPAPEGVALPRQP